MISIYISSIYWYVTDLVFTELPYYSLENWSYWSAFNLLVFQKWFSAHSNISCLPIFAANLPSGVKKFPAESNTAAWHPMIRLSRWKSISREFTVVFRESLRIGRFWGVIWAALDSVKTIVLVKFGVPNLGNFANIVDKALDQAAKIASTSTRLWS